MKSGAPSTIYCPDCKLPAHLCGSHTGKGCEGHWVQCTSVYQGTPRDRDVTIRFCSRRKGHEGDHRGDRVQWNQKGEKVKISLPPDVK